MPELKFELMLINNNKVDKTKEITSDKLKIWFNKSCITFLDNPDDQKLKFKSKNGEILFSFELFEYSSKNSTSAYILTLKSLTNVYKKKIFLYSDFVKEIKIILNRNHCESFFLNRELSKYYSKELYGIFNDFEVTLRRLMHLVFFKNYGHHWEEKFVDRKTLNDLKGKIKNSKSDHIIEEMNLYDIESLLFKEIVIECKKDSITTFEIMQDIGSYEDPNYVVSPEFILGNSDGVFRKFSLWEEVFSKHISKEFRGDTFEQNFKKMRQIRNQVAHNKKVNYYEFEFIKSFLKKFTKEMTLISIEASYENIPELSASLASAIQDSISPIFENLKYLNSLTNNPKMLELSKSLSNFQIDPKIAGLSKSLSNLQIDPKLLDFTKNIRNLGTFKTTQELSRPFANFESDSDSPITDTENHDEDTKTGGTTGNKDQHSDIDC